MSYSVAQYAYLGANAADNPGYVLATLDLETGDYSQFTGTQVDAGCFLQADAPDAHGGTNCLTAAVNVNGTNGVANAHKDFNVGIAEDYGVECWVRCNRYTAGGYYTTSSKGPLCVSDQTTGDWMARLAFSGDRTVRVVYANASWSPTQLGTGEFTFGVFEWVKFRFSFRNRRDMLVDIKVEWSNNGRSWFTLAEGKDVAARGGTESGVTKRFIMGFAGSQWENGDFEFDFDDGVIWRRNPPSVLTQAKTTGFLFRRQPTFQRPNGPVQIDWQSPISQGLVACVPLDDAFRDAIYGQLPTVGPTYGVFGKWAFGFGPYFDANQDHVSYGKNLPSTDDGTVALWFLKRPTSAYQRFCESAGYDIGFWVGTGETDSLVGGSFKRNTAPYGSFVSCPVYEWHHLTVVRRAGTNVAYLDGGKSIGASCDSSTPTTSAPLWIGSDYTGNARASALLSDVRIYNRALSPAEVANLYTDPWSLYWTRQRTYFGPMTETPPAEASDSPLFFRRPMRRLRLFR